MSQGNSAPSGAVSRLVNGIEETVIAVLLGAMTILTFVNVVLRYGGGTALFDGFEGLTGIDLPPSIIWSLEVVLIMFAWLVLFGVAYAFKVTANLGVDAVTALFDTRGRRMFGLISGVICILYALLVLKGAWDYWAPFADLPKTTGRILPTGFDYEARRYGYTITGDVPIPFEWMRTWLSETFNTYEDGGEILVETYPKMPVLVPYLIIPVGAALMLFRICQATLRIWRHEAESLIVSHEAEDAVEEAARANADAEAAGAGRIGNRGLPPGAATAPNLTKEG